MKNTNLLFLFISLLFFASPTFAQQAEKSIQRQEIDAKRMDSNPFSDDALPRSREFIRIDKTYYVGYLFEGIYKKQHAADFLGYKNAITPLKKALELLEKDYASQLKIRSSDLFTYYPVYTYHIDYSMLASELVECYNNIQQPEEAFIVAQKALKWNFQRDFYFNPYIQMSWVVHRNRFYTSKDDFFLKNTIPENEELANSYLDSALRKINIDARLNTGIFQPEYKEQDRQRVYHYKAILYSYALNIDSADKYYALLMDSRIPSYNNFGTYLSIKGQFRDAASMYEKASEQDNGDKRLQEWAYYSSILKIYQGKPDVARETMTAMIKAVGSTPGFGWYNIALARADSYDGDLISSKRHLLKAESFKEVHIGTTLGQTHYDFSVNLIKLLNQNKKIQQIKFENKGWWYHPSDLFNVIKLTTQKYLLEYLIVNQLASNPERDLVVYSLFSPESTVSWDEIWYLIQGFSTRYFQKEFQEKLENDPRPLVKKYFRLFSAKLKINQGKYDEAEEILHLLIGSPEVDPASEELFLARCYEALNQCAVKNKEKFLSIETMNQLYEVFPQLIPYSDMKMNFKLNTSGNIDKKMLSKIKAFRINWLTDSDPNVLIVNLDFKQVNNKKSVVYSLSNSSGKIILPQQEYVYKNGEKEARNIMYGIFNIHLNAQLQTQ